jgi:hypothetical protein
MGRKFLLTRKEERNNEPLNKSVELPAEERAKCEHPQRHMCKCGRHSVCPVCQMMRARYEHSIVVLCRNTVPAEA